MNTHIGKIERQYSAAFVQAESKTAFDEHKVGPQLKRMIPGLKLPANFKLPTKPSYLNQTACRKGPKSMQTSKDIDSPNLVPSSPLSTPRRGPKLLRTSTPRRSNSITSSASIESLNRSIDQELILKVVRCDSILTDEQLRFIRVDAEDCRASSGKGSPGNGQSSSSFQRNGIISDSNSPEQSDFNSEQPKRSTGNSDQKQTSAEGLFDSESSSIVGGVALAMITTHDNSEDLNADDAPNEQSPVVPLNDDSSIIFQVIVPQSNSASPGEMVEPSVDDNETEYSEIAPECGSNGMEADPNEVLPEIASYITIESEPHLSASSNERNPESFLNVQNNDLTEPHGQQNHMNETGAVAPIDGTEINDHEQNDPLLILSPEDAIKEAEEDLLRALQPLKDSFKEKHLQFNALESEKSKAYADLELKLLASEERNRTMLEHVNKLQEQLKEEVDKAIAETKKKRWCWKCQEELPSINAFNVPVCKRCFGFDW